MIKSLLTLIIVFTVVFYSNAQVRDTRIKIDTTEVSALQFESDLSENEAEDAIEGYFDSLHIEKEKGKGFIIKKSLGYMLFKRARVENSDEDYDYYFTVDNKKQKGKDGSIISMAIGKGIGSYFSPNDKKAWEGSTGFANYLLSNYFEQFKIYMQLAETKKNMEKRKQKLDDVLKQKKDLESNISNDSLQIANFNDALLKLKTKSQ